MLKFTKLPDFDPRLPDTKTVLRVLGQVFRGSVREWVSEMRDVPVWSGQAAGSLQPLANFMRVPFDISPRVKSRVNEGRAKGLRFNVIPTTDNPTSPFFGFEWTSGVEYFAANEETATFIKNTPWHLTVKAHQAMDDYQEKKIEERLGQYLG